LRQGEVITGGFPVLEKLEDGSRDLLPLRALDGLAFSRHLVPSILQDALAAGVPVLR
jgi:hypothetical protein